MLSASDVESIAAVCSAISNAAADDSGFVPVRDLLTRFNARLVIRPLLVEGMLASQAADDATNGEVRRWTVLVDSETYDVSLGDVTRENGLDPLPTRLRNTVAHELVHTFALRPRDFGLRLRNDAKDAKSAAEFVRKVEEQTEQLSPLLLCSEKALEQWIGHRKTTVTIDDLVRMYLSLGLSRHVLVNRLRLVRPDDPSRLRFSAGLRDIAVGLAQWTPQGIAVLRKWPLFVNFEANIVPAFLHEVIRHDFFNPLNLIHDRRLALCGGLEKSARLSVPAGTSSAPAVERMHIEIAVEETSRGPGSESIFLVRKLPI